MTLYKLSTCTNQQAKPSKDYALPIHYVDRLVTEECTGGHCSKLQRKCLCTKVCVFEKDSNEVKTTLGGEAKTLSEAVLEEESTIE
uniref:Uncharacterized protein n=1 Tax=Solanum lycopersicum TaxID=4081 RepID=A0A3Q7IUP5_SOLLC